MGGGLIQLVAYGAQDIYLTGQPQITFFKSVYRRHTNFAMEPIECQLPQSVENGRRISFPIERQGDLLLDLELEVPVQDSTAFNHDLDPFRIIREAELEIGGTVISKIYGDWMQVWARITYARDDSKSDNLDACMNANGFVANEKLHIPFLFWWVTNPSLALPLVALQYHEVRINMIINTQIQASFYTYLIADGIKVWATYGYLDTHERQKFTVGSHEYLITQVQHISKDYPVTETELQIPLNSLNHPISYLMWWGNKTSDDGNATALYTKAKITMNGQDRIKYRPMDYFQRYQPYLHFNGCPPVEGVEHASVYSFAINGSEHKPSGSCNFSRIDDAKLIIKKDDTVDVPSNWGPGTWWVWAQNYNIMRIQSGMAGVAFSN